MEEQRARELARLLVEAAGQTDSELEFHGAETLSDFHAFVNNRLNLGLFRTPSGPGAIWLVLCEFNPDNRPGEYYLVVFPEKKETSLIEACETDGDALVWRYRPVKRDDRNLLRKERFAEIMGGEQVRVPLPRDRAAVAEFLSVVNRIVIARTRAEEAIGVETDATSLGEAHETVGPVRKTRYWKISPGGGARYWEQWREHGVISIGWGALGDLANVSREEFEQRMAIALKENSGFTVRKLEQVWKFRNFRPGDRVVANAGTTEVLGIGTVVGPYEHIDGRGDSTWDQRHPHRIAVRWDDPTRRRVNRLGWRRTLIKLKRADLLEFEGAPEIGPGSKPSPVIKKGGDPTTSPILDFEEILSALEDQRLFFPEEVVANFLLSLQVKRFVILTGISGTGKTRLALEVARALQDTSLDDSGSTAGGEEGTPIPVRPYMLNHKRIVIPAALATEFLSVVDDARFDRLTVELPDGSHHQQNGWHKPGTNLLVTNFSGRVKEWFLDEFAEGDVVNLTVVEDQSSTMPILRIDPSKVATPSTAESYRVIAVRPDWTDNRGLLGYHNPLLDQYVTTPFLELLLDATEECRLAERENRPPRPFFAILDEMNLARVEHYFSDFLSAMESGEAIDLHRDAAIEEGETETGVAVPRELRVPPNLLFVGTVNVDETTYLFSPKVLDRAFTLEFNEVDLHAYAAAAVPDVEQDPDPSSPLSLVRFTGSLSVEENPGPPDWDRFCQLGPEPREAVQAINDILAGENRHFGYRVANEIARYVWLAREQCTEGSEAVRVALDLALLQKVLPKLHGTQQELEELLDRLFAFAITGEDRSGGEEAVLRSSWRPAGGRLEPAGDNDSPSAPRFPRLAAKLWRMARRLEQQGFTSFIE